MPLPLRSQLLDSMLPSGRIVWTSSFSCFCHKLSLGTKRKRAARSVNPSKTLIFPEASCVFSTWAASALHWQRMFGVNFKRKLQAVESHCIMSAKCLSGTRRLQMSIDPPGLQQHETKTHPPSRRVPLFSLSLSIPCCLHLDSKEELWLHQNLSKINARFQVMLWQEATGLVLLSRATAISILGATRKLLL